MTPKINYEEGDIFTIPLCNNDIAIGVVARKSPGGSGVLGYFFINHGLKENDLESLGNRLNLISSKAILVVTFGDPSLVRGKWKIVGKMVPWIRSAWPVPTYARPHPLKPGYSFKITYDDNDPLLEIESKLIMGDGGLDIDASYGDRAIEIMLNRKIESNK